MWNKAYFPGHRIITHWIFNYEVSFFLITKCCCLITKWCSTLLLSHGLLSARLLCPRDFPDKNTGMGCHFLFQTMNFQFYTNLNFQFFPAKGTVSRGEMLMKAKLGLEVQLKPGLVFSQEFLGLTKNTDDWGCRREVLSHQQASNDV